MGLVQRCCWRLFSETVPMNIFKYTIKFRVVSKSLRLDALTYISNKIRSGLFNELKKLITQIEVIVAPVVRLRGWRDSGVKKSTRPMCMRGRLTLAANSLSSR